MPQPAATLDAVRRFNRLYTRRIGVLQEGLLGSPFSLTEVRVLYELAHRRRTTASDLVRELGLDAGYVSRILRGFQKRRLITRTRSREDARQSVVTLTAAGRRSLAPLEEKSRAEAGVLLGTVPEASRPRLLAAMRTIEELLDGAGPRGAVVLRAHQPGDVGWVVHRHGVLYAKERGYDLKFEGLVAQVAADFLRRFDPAAEHCWMAERDGELVGSVFLVRKSKGVAQLRLLLVEPSARGLGVGRKLVEECVRFARRKRYRKIALWTHNDLDAARHLYREAGFTVSKETKSHGYGHDLVEETWELDLR